MNKLFPPPTPPTKKLDNHAMSWQISFKFCRSSSYGVVTIWVKFQENWRGCLDHFLIIDTEWPCFMVKIWSNFCPLMWDNVDACLLQCPTNLPIAFLHKVYHFSRTLVLIYRKVFLSCAEHFSCHAPLILIATKSVFTKFNFRCPKRLAAPFRKTTISLFNYYSGISVIVINRCADAKWLWSISFHLFSITVIGLTSTDSIWSLLRSSTIMLLMMVVAFVSSSIFWITLPISMKICADKRLTWTWFCFIV